MAQRAQQADGAGAGAQGQELHVSLEGMEGGAGDADECAASRPWKLLGDGWIAGRAQMLHASLLSSTALFVCLRQYVRESIVSAFSVTDATACVAAGARREDAQRAREDAAARLSDQMLRKFEEDWRPAVENLEEAALAFDDLEGAPLADSCGAGCRVLVLTA
jgi:hypothetical protein